MRPHLKLLHALALVPFALSVGCSSPTSVLDEPGLDSGTERSLTDDASTTPDGGVLADAGRGPDGGAPDLGVPTLASCDTEALTVRRLVPEPGTRVQLTPTALAAWRDGWLLFYSESTSRGGGRRLAILGRDGQVLGDEELHFSDIRHVFVDRDTVVVFGSVEVTRLDLGADRVVRRYTTVPVTSVDGAVGPLPELRVRGWRRVSVAYDAALHARLELNDVELDRRSASGLSVRTRTLDPGDDLGALGAYALHVRRGGARALVQLVGTGWRPEQTWQRLVLEVLDAQDPPLAWSLAESAPVTFAEPPRAILGQSDDGRWAVIERERERGVAIVPLPGVEVRAPLPVFEGPVDDVLTGFGRVGVLTRDRVRVYDGAALRPILELPVDGGWARVADDAARVAVASTVLEMPSTDGPMRLVLRCAALPPGAD